LEISIRLRRAKGNRSNGRRSRLNAFAPLNFDSKTVWSMRLTAFARRLLRQPQLSSDALFLIPSASWGISADWNASLAVEMLGRWYDPNTLGETSRDWEVLPIATLEYIIPASLFESDEFANLIAAQRSTFRARTGGEL
jgi:hypothetical protein